LLSTSSGIAAAARTARAAHGVIAAAAARRASRASRADNRGRAIDRVLVRRERYQRWAYGVIGVICGFRPRKRVGVGRWVRADAWALNRGIPTRVTGA
jgi:hypothetical protein